MRPAKGEGTAAQKSDAHTVSRFGNSLPPRYFAHSRHFAFNYSIPPSYFAHSRHFVAIYSIPSRYFAFPRHLSAINSFPPSYFAHSHHFVANYSIPSRYFANPRHLTVSYSITPRYFAHLTILKRSCPLIGTTPTHFYYYTMNKRDIYVLKSEAPAFTDEKSPWYSHSDFSSNLGAPAK